MTQTRGPYQPTGNPPEGPELPRRTIANTGVSVPIIGHSIRSESPGFSIDAVSPATDSVCVPSARQHSGLPTDFLDVRLGNHTTLPDNHAGTLLVRIGLTPEHAGNTELNTAHFSRETLLEQWEQVERQLARPDRVILVVEGLAALCNTDLENEVYFASCVDTCLQTLNELQAEQRIAGYGLVADHAEYCQRALMHGHWDVFVLNHRYTLLEQWPLFNLLPDCAEADTSVIVGHPFNTGIFRGQDRWNFKTPPDFVRARLENIRHICHLHEVPMEAVALQFPLGHPVVASILVDPLKQSDDTLRQWLNYPLSNSLWDDLKLGGVMHEEAPVVITLHA